MAKVLIERKNNKISKAVGWEFEELLQRLADDEVVKAIVMLGHSLGRAVVAEGIESPAQLAKLRELECGFGQGYLLARPLTAEMASAWLEAEGSAGDAERDSRANLETTGFGSITMH